jgi:cellobiose phosphorylase
MEELGLGARGLVAMGTGDYADGVLSLSSEETTPTGSSSTYNAMLIALGLPAAADAVESRDAELAAALRALVASQVAALEREAWSGTQYHRGFVDSGNPLAPELLFLEPQILPILAGLTDPARTSALLDLVTARLETPIGAVSTAALEPGGTMGGVDMPQIGGVWPVANAWLTEAYAMRDPTEGWESFTKNSLMQHAELFPSIWYGIWTGPDSFYGPDAERPGEADAHLATALTDYPALNAHVHTSPLRALYGLLGLRGTRDGLALAPRLPTEDYAVVMPRLAVRSESARIEVRVVVATTGPLALHVRLPSALRTGAVRVTVDGVDATSATMREGDGVAVPIEAIAETPFTVVVEPS